jgi:hypothetical protein
MTRQRAFSLQAHHASPTEAPWQRPRRSDLRPEVLERFVGGHSSVVLSASADIRTVQVEIEAVGVGRLRLSTADWGYDRSTRELRIDPVLLAPTSVVRVRYTLAA